MIDIIFAIFMVMAIIKGYRKGLVVAAFSIVAYIIGLAAALKLSAVVAGYLQHNINVSNRWLPFISFAVVFIAVVILVNWAGKLVQETFEMVMLGWLNRIGGVVFYAALYIIIFSIFLFYAEKIHLINDDSFKNSATYSFVKPWGPVVIDSFGKLVPVFKEMFTQLESFFASVSGNLQH
jgi:membrane protein required for colicin V production